uniref:NADH-plastoquinone oxidoreductase subunit 4 n=1 Tax=Vachellia nilotica TaxID=138033 RepID=A0A650F2P0_9FABA|nr:NADH-plastoquinone oxidoreductase subunit 4 [Vachellia nilotica]QGT77195.1 NADH-plastoquinone oxidoreductase subunit 4 [Vachellia nilotica]
MFFSLVNNSCSFPNIRRFLNLLISPLRKYGNLVVYYFYMLNESPYNNLCILLSFPIGRSINPIDGELYMDPIFCFLLEIRNRWTLYRPYFTDGIYHHFSYFSGSTGYSGIPIIPFPDVSNVLRSNRIIFFSRHFTFFHDVGIRINSCLSTFIHVGWKETFVFSYKVYFVYCRKFHFFYYWEFSVSVYMVRMNQHLIWKHQLINRILWHWKYYSILDFLLLLLSNRRLYPYIHGYQTPTERHITVLVCFLPESYYKWERMDWFELIWNYYPTLILYFLPGYFYLAQFKYSMQLQHLLVNVIYKKRIAYSSVSHMGFIIIGICSISDTGLNGAILQIISHGFIGAALFFLAGTSYDRIRLYYLDEMGGMAIPMPKIFTVFSILSMASLALPGMSGFVAELIVFFGIITSQKYLLMTKILITFVMAIGMILTPIYSLSMLRQMFYGYKFFNKPNSLFFDSGPRELFISISILIPVIGIGIYPDFIFSLSVDKVEAILSNFL